MTDPREELLGELRSLTGRLEALDEEHVRATGPGAALAAVAAAPAAAVVAGAALVPLLDPAGLGWLALVTVPAGGAAVALAWRVIRRTTTPHGPVGAACRALLRRRDEVLDALYALPGGTSGAPGAEPEAEWRRIAEVYREVADADRAAALTRPGDARASAGRLGRNAGWFLAGLLLTGLLALLCVGVPVGVAADPGLWILLMPLAVWAAGWAPVLRVAFLKSLGPPRRVTRTRKRGWRDELAYRRHRLTSGGGVAPWRFPAFHAERLWRWLGGPLWRALGLSAARSPAEVLRTMPAGASFARKWYWRWVGPGTVALAAVVLAAVALTVLRGTP
ncbi:hypothetical protein RM780_22035 [Streptomyces sp. DSM 44917]|uniref:Uncharacterized protein n=1 Tax=Streptomyces boetiae TaxID=3075541 RepID=A0ABU2LDG4_9ACTN|nr:hypothetical protein [Streptomyces sp. DSM 44917]MDT0309617.1 hypothetical protein [Streptomyces sp. DSM 44917]